MRGIGWIVAAAGLVLVLVATGFIGDRDESGETVPASEWAEDVCAAVGVWRGQVEAISTSFRISSGSNENTEDSAPTPEGKLGAAQIALERAIDAAETLVEAVDRAGTPDTEGGEEAARQVSSWASGARDDLEQAEDLLDDEPDTLEEDIERVTVAGRQLAGVLRSGRQVLAEAAASDPELRDAFSESVECRRVRVEGG